MSEFFRLVQFRTRSHAAYGIGGGRFRHDEGDSGACGSGRPGLLDVSEGGGIPHRF